MKSDETVYRLDPRPGMRLFGLRFVLAAVLVVVAWLLAGVFDDGAGLAAAWVVGALAALLVVVSVLLLVRPPAVVRLDDEGYRLGRVPQGGVRKARWRDVSRATARDSLHGYALVIEVGDGTSTVPLLLVAARANELQHEVNERLNRAHGYRRLE
ncbi:hypothetical protein [Solicola gregarius]|uniref:PH domain-containing protein n=1 Tax=Solicola gregarius TaxID=2908642 RepID=A0AA46TLT4_9ACTN|nr:hypothetical protein [Solicola gregarius]UYM07615.1 hypothetical protein L0C25_11240 [Solicola gregarius]